jgi:hypothetical protein
MDVYIGNSFDNTGNYLVQAVVRNNVLMTQKKIMAMPLFYCYVIN